MNDLLDDIKVEGSPIEEEDTQIEDLLKDEPEDDPEDSSPEDTEKEGDSSQDEDKKEAEEKPVPFHEHPRWKKMQDDNKELRDKLEGQSDLSDTVKEIQKNQSKPEEALPAYWITLYGNDEVSHKAYAQQKVHEEERDTALQQKWTAEQTSAQELAANETKKYDEWVDTEIETLKAEGKTFERNELLKVAMEMQPTDGNGNISLRKSLEILELQKKGSKDKTDRKKVADLTNSDNQGGDTTSTGLTSHQMRGQSMDALVHGKD